MGEESRLAGFLREGFGVGEMGPSSQMNIWAGFGMGP